LRGALLNAAIIRITDGIKVLCREIDEFK